MHPWLRRSFCALAILTVAVPAQAQTRSLFDGYRDGLAKDLVAEKQLESEISALNIPTYFCGHPSKAEMTATLAAMRRRYETLQRDYATMRANIIQTVRGGSEHATSFEAGTGENGPESQNYWRPSDRAMQGAEPLLKLAEAELARSRDFDCSEEAKPVTRPAPVPTPVSAPGVRVPSWPPVAMIDPLGELPPPADRVLPPLPPMPARLCNEAEKFVWYDGTFKPAYDRFLRVSQPILTWRARLGARHTTLMQQIYDLQHPGGGNPNLVTELQRQDALVEAAMRGVEPLAQQAMTRQAEFDRMAAAVMAMKPQDCPGAKTASARPALVEPLPLDLRYPELPGSFCTEAEKSAFVARVQSLLQAARLQATEWSEYAFVAHRQADQAARARSHLVSLQALEASAKSVAVKNCSRGGAEQDTLMIDLAPRAPSFYRPPVPGEKFLSPLTGKPGSDRESQDMAKLVRIYEITHQAIVDADANPRCAGVEAARLGPPKMKAMRDAIADLTNGMAAYFRTWMGDLGDARQGQGAARTQYIAGKNKLIPYFRTHARPPVIPNCGPPLPATPIQGPQRLPPLPPPATIRMHQ